MAKQDSTRERLMSAAGEIFARDGFQKAGVREICEAAGGANVASVKYYFGGKIGLYREVIRAAMTDLHSKRPVPVEGLDPQEALANWLRQFLELTLIHRHNHPYAGRIMKHELREPTEILDEIVQNVIGPIHKELARVLAKVTGLQSNSNANRQTAALVLSMCANLETSRPVLERLGARIPVDPAAVGVFASEITEFVLHGVMGGNK